MKKIYYKPQNSVTELKPLTVLCGSIFDGGDSGENIYDGN